MYMTTEPEKDVVHFDVMSVLFGLETDKSKPIQHLKHKNVGLSSRIFNLSSL